MGRPAADLVQPAGNGHRGRLARRCGASDRIEIVAEIGQGGMGEVYRAERIDGQFDQQVAIKLVRVGMGSAFIVERFLHERQILATLNHPNIARLLDGGTTDDGVPYLVMELIDGDRIDTYCQAHRLSVSRAPRLISPGLRGRCSTPISAWSFIAISSPATFLSPEMASPSCSISALRRSLIRLGDSETTLARPMTLGVRQS